MAFKKPNRVRETMSQIMIERVEKRRAAGENVLAPWKMTWDPRVGMPRNLVSQHPYRGVNIWLTLLSGYGSPFWITEKQASKIGGEIKRLDDGSREPYTPIMFWWFPTKEQRDEGRFAFVKFYRVWNVAQVDGIEDHRNMVIGKGEPVNPIEEAEALVNGFVGRPEIVHGGGRACYRPSADRVEMPAMAAFDSAAEYYRALFHELTHSTGHRKRLERDGIANPAKFASHEYSEEELIAEMGATMLSSFAGIASEEANENSAAYLDHWLRKLAAEPRMLAQAGGEAQKAIDLIRGIKWEAS